MKRMAVLFAFLSMLASGSSFASDRADVEKLRNLEQKQLDSIYATAEPGTMPDGESAGTAVFFAGTQLAQPLTRIAALFWQGKVFDANEGILLNKVVGFNAIKAKVFFGKSLFDGKKSIIIDYRDTSIVAGRVRDEIRELSDGLYLGRAYYRTPLFGPIMVVNFILDFR